MLTNGFYILVQLASESVHDINDDCVHRLSSSRDRSRLLVEHYYPHFFHSLLDIHPIKDMALAQTTGLVTQPT